MDPMSQTMPPMMAQKKSRGWVVVVVIIAVAGALYLYRDRLIPQSAEPAASGVSNDEIALIESDLQSVDLGSLGSEVSDIEKELQ